MTCAVGYSTCHWCHVMERESFSDVNIARLLNDNYVPIKVDREERPDVDQVYMTFVQVNGCNYMAHIITYLNPTKLKVSLTRRQQQAEVAGQCPFGLLRA